jgi:hypothetical protein
MMMFNNKYIREVPSTQVFRAVELTVYFRNVFRCIGHRHATLQVLSAELSLAIRWSVFLRLGSTCKEKR